MSVKVKMVSSNDLRESMMDKLKKETRESLRAKLSTYQVKYPRARICYFQEMKDTRATFSFKSTRLQRCSYGFYSKDVFNIEESVKELQDLISMFWKLSFVWCNTVPQDEDHQVPVFPTNEENCFFDYGMDHSIDREMEDTMKTIRKKFDKFKSRLDKETSNTDTLPDNSRVDVSGEAHSVDPSSTKSSLKEDVTSCLVMTALGYEQSKPSISSPVSPMSMPGFQSSPSTTVPSSPLSSSVREQRCNQEGRERIHQSSDSPSQSSSSVSSSTAASLMSTAAGRGCFKSTKSSATKRKLCFDKGRSRIYYPEDPPSYVSLWRDSEPDQELPLKSDGRGRVRRWTSSLLSSSTAASSLSTAAGTSSLPARKNRENDPPVTRKSREIQI